MDDNEDSYINMSELSPYLQLSFGPDLKYEEEQALFSIIDTTKRSVIERKEMVTFFNKIFAYIKAL